MEPMKSMEPMKPMARPECWWPAKLGDPSTSGSQNNMSYAFFRQACRLLVKIDGKITAYDTGDRLINGVAQQQDTHQSLAFNSDNGEVNLEDLTRTNIPA